MTQINKLPSFDFRKQSGNTAKYKNVPKPYLDVAKGMETQFINHMITQMRSTVKSETPESSSSQYYKSLMDNERAKIMADTENGVGLKDIILDQILPQHLKQQANAKDVINKYQHNADSRREIDNE